MNEHAFGLVKDLPAGLPNLEAEIGVLEIHRVFRGEPAHLLKKVPGDEKTGTRHGRDFTCAVDIGIVFILMQMPMQWPYGIVSLFAPEEFNAAMLNTAIRVKQL